MTEQAYLVATVKDWNIDAFERNVTRLPGQWTLITRPEELTIELIDHLRPRYVFFPHWSWKVPESILNRVECVCFHMTDVPYGRGGSPMQNLITRGHRTTKLSALRMVQQLDAGPVYLKHDLELNGSAQQIFERTAERIYRMIEELIREEPVPRKQKGKVTLFPRRTQDMSRLPDEGTLGSLYDHIRMLDADTYPRAFIDYGEFRITFGEAEMDNAGVLKARIHIERRGEKG